MTGVNKSRMAMLVAALLLGALVSAVWARPNHSPQAADITRKITFSVWDISKTANASPSMWRTAPRTQTEVRMAYVCSPGVPGGPESLEESTIDYAGV